MLTSEETIQQTLNETGCIATAALKLDTDGSEIDIAGDVMRTKGEQPKAYQTLMGKLWLSVMSINAQVVVEPIAPGTRSQNHYDFNATVCQTGVPQTGLWFSARCATRSSGKPRRPAVSYIQRVSEAVASIIEAKEESWNYVPPKLRLRLPASPLA